MSEDRKIFYVDVGGMPAEEAVAHIKQVTAEFIAASKAKQALLESVELTANTLSGIAPLV